MLNLEEVKQNQRKIDRRQEKIDMYEKRRDILLTIIPKVIRYSQVSIYRDLNNVYICIVTDFMLTLDITIPVKDFLNEKPDVILCDILNQFMDKLVDCYTDMLVYSVASTYLSNKEVVEELSNEQYLYQRY